MSYYPYTQSTAYNTPQASVQWGSPVPPNTPVLMESIAIPGLEDLMPPSSSMSPSYPVQLATVQAQSVQAPTSSAYSADTTGFVEAVPQQPQQVLQYVAPEISEARSRFIRRQKRLLDEKINSWLYLQHHNQSQIPLQGIQSLLFPYGAVTDSEVLMFWGTPQEESCSYLISSQLSLGYKTSYSIVIPSLEVNLIPMVLAEALDPTVTRGGERTIYTPELGPVVTYGEIFVTVRLGSERLLVGFTMTTSSQVLVFGDGACSLFGMTYCPIKNKIVTASGEALSTIKLPTQWLQQP